MSEEEDESNTSCVTTTNGFTAFHPQCRPGDRFTSTESNWMKRARLVEPNVQLHTAGAKLRTELRAAPPSLPALSGSLHSAVCCRSSPAHSQSFSPVTARTPSPNLRSSRFNLFERFSSPSVDILNRSQQFEHKVENTKSELINFSDCKDSRLFH
ncbi:hypothetical protein PAMP_016912 [Pampus punctatissimus]